MSYKFRINPVFEANKARFSTKEKQQFHHSLDSLGLGKILFKLLPPLIYLNIKSFLNSNKNKFKSKTFFSKIENDLN